MKKETEGAEYYRKQGKAQAISEFKEKLKEEAKRRCYEITNGQGIAFQIMQIYEEQIEKTAQEIK